MLYFLCNFADFKILLCLFLCLFVCFLHHIFLRPTPTLKMRHFTRTFYICKKLNVTKLYSHDKFFLNLPLLILLAGIIASNNELWKEHRKLSLTVLRSFGVGKRSFEDQIAVETGFLMEEIDSLNGGPFNPTHLLCNAVSNVICSVVFGKRYEYDDAEFKRLLYLLENKNASPFELLATRRLSFLLKVPYFPQNSLMCTTELRLKFQNIVAEHHTSFDANNMRDFVDAYIKEMNEGKEQGKETHLSDSNLLAVLDDLFLAGTETTSTTLRWAILYMIAFPDVQRKVREEIDRVVGRSRVPKLSDKINLPYTDAVIHEVQRFGSILHVLPARFTLNDVNFHGFTIPKKSAIFCNLYSSTRDSSIWQDPDDFKPERFLDESGMVVKVQEHIVFGAGMS